MCSGGRWVAAGPATPAARCPLTASSPSRPSRAPTAARAGGLQGRVRGDRFHRRPSRQLPLRGYKVLSSLPIEVGRLLGEGEPFVYAYYDGIDKVAHGSGLGDLYDAELRAVDRLVADLVADAPARCGLVVTADHGEIDVGEGRAARPGHHGHGPLHVRRGSLPLAARPSGAAGDLHDAAADRYGDTTWVMGRDELIAAGLFGGPLSDDLLTRLGDVALLPRAPIAFHRPGRTPARTGCTAATDP